MPPRPRPRPPDRTAHAMCCLLGWEATLILGPSTLLILGALLDSRQDRLPPPSYRDLARAAGISYNAVAQAIRRLARADLVRLDPVSRGHTIPLPACRFVPADRLDTPRP